MDKNKIKSYLSSSFLNEANDKAIGLEKTEAILKQNKATNNSELKNVAKDMEDYTKSLDSNLKNNAKTVKKRELSKDEKDIHDNIELFQDTMLPLDYDSPVDDKSKDRFEKAIAGDPTMGNSSEYANVVPKQKGFTGPEFGKTLIDKTKKMSKVQQNVVGGGNTMLPYGVKNGNFAVNENNDNKENKMKRLVFKNPFNGLDNALNLIPETYKIDDKVFEITDGNESYKVRWEGTLTEGRAIVLMGSSKEQVNEDISKIKHLMGYSSEKTLGTLKGNQRLDENKRFSDIWGKTKSLLTESNEDNLNEGDDINEIENEENKIPTDTENALDKLGGNSTIQMAMNKIDKKDEFISFMSGIFTDLISKHPEFASSISLLMGTLKNDAKEIAQQGMNKSGIQNEEEIKNETPFTDDTEVIAQQGIDRAKTYQNEEETMDEFEEDRLSEIFKGLDEI
jgi:hypothetical protein